MSLGGTNPGPPSTRRGTMVSAEAVPTPSRNLRRLIVVMAVFPGGDRTTRVASALILRGADLQVGLIPFVSTFRRTVICCRPEGRRHMAWRPM